MASYIQSWWYGASTTTTTTTTTRTTDQYKPTSSSPTQPPVSLSIIPPDDLSEDESDHDIPPAFPALNSIQRSTSSPSMPNTLKKPKTLIDAELMPPPPSLPTATLRTPYSTNSSSLRVPQSLQPPTSTTRSPTLSPKKRAKVVLAPGHSPLDWAALKSSGTDLRGTTSLLRIPPSMLKLHNKRDDAWSVFNGKVYNITPYLAFHPGGEKQLLRVAGRDGTKLFASTHAWVNVEFMLDECLVGFLVSEPESVDSD
ncbi:cytochrome b5 [Hysterangium stoloniferum]|nr:cytochrome b5 [Hysterangium stoloniferum]